MIITSQGLAAMRTGFKTIFNNVFSATPSFWEKVGMLVSSSAAEETYVWLNDLSGLREWIGDRVIQSLKEEGYTIRNRAFEKTIEVLRDKIEDDQVGIYSPMFQMLGRNAKVHPDQLIFGLLKDGFSGRCFDGQYFFDSDHPVLVNGVAQSVSNYTAGANTPWYLLCTSMPVKPLIFQKRKDYTFVSRDRDPDDNVFNRRSYQYGVDARVNVGYGLWQLAYGSKSDLDADNYALARAAMMSLKADNGEPLGIVPNLLVVPPSLEGKANKIAKVAFGANGATNEWAGTADVLVVPYLS